MFGVQDEISNAVYDKHFGLLNTAIDGQVDVYRRFSVLSPRMALGLLSQELAGTSLAHQRSFERGAERYRRQLMSTLNNDITLHSRAGQSDYRAGPELWRRTGEYRYDHESLRAVLPRCAAPLTVLVLWFVALLAASWLTVRHLRVARIMKLLRRMLGPELRLLRSDGYVAWALLALVLLLLAAGFNGRALLGVQADTAAALTTDTGQTRNALRGQAASGVATATDPGALGLSVLTAPAVLPPAPLGGLAIGQNDLLPAYYEVTARGEYSFLSRHELDNALRLSVGNFDVAFVVVWLLPLLVIALAFNIVSGERERGVLAQAVAAGASPAEFVAIKVLTRAGALAVAICAGLVLAALAAGVPLAEPGSLVLLALWILATLLYAAFWFALSLFVNSRPRASDQNASLLAGLWLLLVIVAPSLTNLAATTLFPAPSRVALTTELREATEQADKDAAKARDQYFFDHPEMGSGEMDKTAYYQSVARSEASIAAAMRPHLAEFDRQALRQRQLVDGLQYFSPGTLTYQLLTALSGSDGNRHSDFREQTVSFHARWSRVLHGSADARRAAQACRLRSHATVCVRTAAGDAVTARIAAAPRDAAAAHRAACRHCAATPASQ